MGTLAIAPLGPEYTAYGVVIGLTAAIFGGLAAALVTRLPVLKSGPITATAVLWAAALAQVLSGARDPDGVARAMALACLCGVMAGAMQVAMGLLRLGSAIKFVPYPVVAGFRNGIGLLMLISQVPVLIGTSHTLDAIPWSRIRDELRPVNVVVGIAVALVMWLLRYTRVRILAPFLAIVAGTALYYLLNALFSVQDTALASRLPPYGEWLGHFVGAIASMDKIALVGDLAALVPHAASIAIVASIFALLGAKVMDQATHSRHDGNRELIAQGAGNIGAGAFGGMPISGLPSQSLLAYHGGGGSRAASLIA
ncbi:MAG TPA: SulP family inorganic anion transporter, partial [Casimicrobiaceae bacterium]